MMGLKNSGIGAYMDVRSFPLLCIVVLHLGLAACSQKTSKTVFSENNPQSSPDSSCSSQRIENRFLVEWENGNFTVETAANADVFTAEFIEPQLEKIRHVEFDKPLQLFDHQLIPASETLSENDFSSWGQEITSAAYAWNQGVKGQGVQVAVVDAAVDYSHPQLRTRLAENSAEINGRPGVDDDGNGLVDDYYGWDFNGKQPTPPVSSSNVHGSHVAGIILADHTQGSVKGMAPKASLIPVNFMDPAGGGTIGDAILSIRYAASRGAKIINASWGGSQCSTSLKNAIAEVGAQGILFVAASGNEYIDFDRDYRQMFPAVFNLSNQITVAATASSDYLTDFSNRSYTLVHIGAPGSNIMSTVPGGVGWLDGTSMAAPFVSGAAALLWSDRPTATLAQVKTALLTSVDVIPGKEYKVSTRGRLNVQKALDKLRSMVP